MQTRVVIEQFPNIDDYGTPPLEFHTLRDFQPDHWTKSFGEEERLEIVQDYEKGDSEFYWHSEEPETPVHLSDFDVVFVKGTKVALLTLKGTEQVWVVLLEHEEKFAYPAYPEHTFVVPLCGVYRGEEIKRLQTKYKDMTGVVAEGALMY